MTDTLLAWKHKLGKLVLHNYRIQLLEEGWDKLDDGGDGDDDNSGILGPLETRNPHNIHYSRLLWVSALEWVDRLEVVRNEEFGFPR